MKKFLLLSVVVVPTVALAANLSYERQSLLYKDAPFLPAEAAGISILTSLGAVEGYPDGAFYPERTLNRAEFLKIALASNPSIRVASSDSADCFPDVRRDEWFSRYVCLAKVRGIIGGYPDGNFRPANAVNYVEALKILSELYGYELPQGEYDHWWQPYVQAAQNHGTILPVNLGYDRYLTRGQMARLAAAYRAEHEGELDLYRRMEAGEDIDGSLASSSSSVSSVPSSSSQSSVSNSQSSESSSSAAPQNAYSAPVQTSILLIGKTQPIGSAVLYPQAKDAHVRVVEVKLEREARSIKQVILADLQGNHLAELRLDLTDDDNETWKVVYDAERENYVLPGGTGTTVVVLAQLKDENSGGFPNDYIKVKSMFVVVSKKDNVYESYQIVPNSANYPVQQTALAKITGVDSVLSGTGELVTGNKQKLGSFVFEGESAGDLADLALEHIQFKLRVSGDVTVSNPYIITSNSQQHNCSQKSSDPSIVNCLVIPYEIGNVPANGRVIELYADLDASSAAPGSLVQASILNPGSRNLQGDVRFTDGSVSVTWMEGEAPLANGKVWVK